MANSKLLADSHSAGFQNYVLDANVNPENSPVFFEGKISISELTACLLTWKDHNLRYATKKINFKVVTKALLEELQTVFEVMKTVMSLMSEGKQRTFV